MLEQERSAPCHGTIIEQHWAAGKNGFRVGAVDRHGSRHTGGSGSGASPGCGSPYDHRFEASGHTATRLEWLVELCGPLAFLFRPVFARIYGRNVERAIPLLQDWFRRPVQTAGG